LTALPVRFGTCERRAALGIFSQVLSFCGSDQPSGAIENANAM
jgi:hypothetical protein